MAFNVKQLLVCVAVVAFALAALVMANKPYVTSLGRFATIGFHVFMSYEIWTTEGERRAFRVGFLACGCVYFLFHVVLNVDALNFGTATLISPLLTVIHPDVYVRDSQGTITGIHGILYENFFLVGHCFLTLLFGVIGGWITVYFYRKRQKLLDSTR